MAEKPLAMDLPTLEGLFRAAEKSKAALVPMHTMRVVPALVVMRQAVRAGDIGDPLISFSPEDLLPTRIAFLARLDKVPNSVSRSGRKELSER
jgi:hypothetical protein